MAQPFMVTATGSSCLWAYILGGAEPHLLPWKQSLLEVPDFPGAYNLGKRGVRMGERDLHGSECLSRPRVVGG